MLRRILLMIILLVTLAVPAAAQDNEDEGCVTPLNLEVGTFITIIGGVYIRALPDIDSGIVSYAPERIPARVLGGPVCADGFNWWQVERVFNEPTFKGWVAEGRPGKPLILPNEPLEDENLCPTPLPIPINQSISVYTGARVRTDPTLAGRVQTVAPPDTTALVLEGPVCADGYNWWRVNVEVVGVQYDGWIVEGTPSGEIIEDAVINPQPDAGPESIACGPPAPLRVGDRAIVRFSGPPLKNLRTAPSTDGTVLYSLPSGIQMEILSDAFCNEGVNWRNVRVFGGSQPVEGWIAEGLWLGRFLGRDGEDYDQPAP